MLWQKKISVWSSLFEIEIKTPSPNSNLDVITPHPETLTDIKAQQLAAAPSGNFSLVTR